jgi:small GTP-binding protein
MGCDISNFGKKTLSATQEIPEKRILLLGLDNAGKTSILIQYKEKTFMPTAVPTIGLNIEQVEFQGFNLTFWDVGGQAVRLWKHYFDSIDAIIYVIDSTDKERC